MSKRTLESMIDSINSKQIQAIPRNSPLKSALELLWNDKGRDSSEQKTFFFYYDNDARGAGNTDCYIYEGVKMPSGWAVGLHKLEPRLSKEPCDLASYDLAALFNYVTTPHDATAVAPSQLYMFANHPNIDIKNLYDKVVADEWLVVNKLLGTPSQRVELSFGDASDVHIPTWAYINEKTSSLSEIANRIGGDNLPWQLLWELNLSSVKDPTRILEGVELLVPARIEAWDEIDPSMLSVDEWSAKLYGDPAYSDLVKSYIDVVKGQPGEELVSIPVFEPGVATLPATLWRFGKP